MTEIALAAWLAANWTEVALWAFTLAVMAWAVTH